MNYHSLRTAANIVKDGGIVAYPTEHCYGLGCDPNNLEAVQRIIKVKRRQQSKGLILIADRIGKLNRYIRCLPEQYGQEILQSWPGPFTWLLPARGNVSRCLRGQHESIAVRVTNHPEAKALSRLSNMALVSTSANRSGRPVLTTAVDVEREFRDDIDYVVQGRVGLASAPSTIRHGTTGIIIRG